MIKINPSILSKTVKVITPKTEKVEEAQIRGTIVYRNQEHFVQLDGAPSNALTPIAEFAEGASDAGFVHGDRVLVLIKNHQAIVTKNLTTGLQAQAAKEASTFTTAITDEGITAQRIIANDTFTNTLRANHITADEIIAGMATIDTLDANYAHITDGVIDNAKIGVADVNDLSANYAHITTGVIDNAKIDVADVNNMSASYAHITNGVIDNAKIGYADVNNLSANYAQIDAANVTDLSAQNAWVNKIMVQTGLIAHESDIFTLDAIQVNAANITAGTIDVNRLIVTVDGEKYLVEIDPTTHRPSYEKLDGGIVEPRTITADKIVAHDITVQEITTENLVGTNGWINLNQGKFFYGNGANYASSTNAIDWNGTTLKIKGDIGDSVIFNSYSTTTEMNAAIGNAVDGIEVGGRNLLRGTGTCTGFEPLNGTTIEVKTDEDMPYIRTSPTAVSWLNTRPLPSFPFSQIQGKTITVSAEVRLLETIGATESAFYLTMEAYDVGTYTSRVGAKDHPCNSNVLTKDEWVKVTYTLDVDKANWTVMSGYTLDDFKFASLAFFNHTAVPMDVRCMKLELGNKATDWTPAPEDATLEEQYVYATYVSGSTSATAPSNWITETGDKQNTWTTKRPTYNSTYPVLFVCKQTKNVGGDVTSTTPLKDDTTTVIDGGHITTGTIDTNRLNANTIKSNIVQTTDLSADRITSGTLDTNRLNANTIKTNIVQTTDLNADKITSGNIAADRIKANVISAINSLTAGQIDAARIKTSQITVGSLSDGSAYSTTTQMNGAINSAVNGVQVGGTNMLIDSTNPTQWDFMTKSAVWARSLIDGGASFNVTTAGASDSWGVLMHQDSTLRNKIVAGQQYNISFDIRYNATLSISAACNIRDSDGTKPLLSDTAFTISFVANQWKHISVSYPAYSTLPTLSNQRLYISVPQLARRTGVIDIKNVKVEVGNKGTDWSPAPEDVINENLLIDSQKMTQWVANTRVSKNTSLEIGEVTLNGSNADWNCVIWSQPLVPVSILDGSPLWLSFEYTASATTSQFRPNLQGSASNAGEVNTARTRWKDIAITLPAASSWTKHSVRMPTTLSEFTAGSGTVNSIYLAFYLYDNVTVKLRKVKLEHGKAPSKWTPAAEEFKTHITRIGDDGISIHAANNATLSQNYVILGAGGLNVYNQGSSVAFYGQTARVGKDNSKHASIDTNGFHVWDGVETTATNEIALFGSTARIGKVNNKRVELDSSSFAVVERNGIAQFSVDATSDSLTRTHTRYLDLTGGGYIAYERFVAPGVGASIKVGASTAIINVKNAITTTLTLPTTIGATTTVTANNVTFAVTKEGRYVYGLDASASSGTNYYAGFTYTTTYQEALVSVNDSLINTKGHYYVPVYAEVGTLDNCEIVTWGRVAQIYLEVHKSSVASGSNVFEGVLTDFLPINDALICGYYGGRACPGKIETSGEITVRNAGSSSVSPTASSPLIVLGTYIFDPDRTAW